MLEPEVYARLAKRCGTPLYVFDEKEFIENYTQLTGCFQKAYPNYRLSYSFKTNYTPYICSLVKKLGGYAEVVSDMEYSLAKKLGYGNERIVYNGPAKGPLLEEHLALGGINNIDNLSEAMRVCRFADMNPSMDIRTGLRINVDLGRGFLSRFGLEPDSAELLEALRELRKRKNIKVNGVHCHLSHARDIAAWEKRAEIMLSAADRYIDGVPEYISLGSGMFGKMDGSLAGQFGCDIPSYEDYAAVTMAKLAARYENCPEADRPAAFTEPGATLISKYISFMASVTDIKTLHGRNFAVTDGSFYNLGEISLKKQLPLRMIVASPAARSCTADIVGYTCLEYDNIYRGYSGPLDVGSLAVFGNAGGYSIVSKPQFIRTNCPMVAVTEGGELKEVMRQETFEDVFSKFSF